MIIVMQASGGMSWLQPSGWSTPVSAVVFVAMAGIIGVAGWRLTVSADRLADRTGWIILVLHALAVVLLFLKSGTS